MESDGALPPTVSRMEMMTYKNLLAIALVALAANELLAGPFGVVTRRARTTGATTTSNTGYYQTDSGELFSAQGAANRMARLLRIGHFGNPTGGWEGVGMGSNPDAAYRNCCYYGQRTIKDSGCTQGANGMWYACCRYH